jgi:nicotinamidase-related amidase
MTADLDLQDSALVLVDLQRGPLALAAAPRGGDDVLANSLRLAEAFREAGALVIVVHASAIGDGSDRLRTPVDEPVPLPHPIPDDFFALPAEIKAAADIFVVKRQWGAFYGTDLDLQLRRRGLRKVVVGGLLTNFGAESTIRAAWEHGYEVIVAEDTLSALTAEDHDFAVRRVFPRLGRVRSTDDLVASLSRAGQAA